MKKFLAAITTVKSVADARFCRCGMAGQSVIEETFLEPEGDLDSCRREMGYDQLGIFIY